MKKRMGVLLSSLLLLFVLASCVKDKAKEEVIEETETKITEEPKSPAKEEPTEQDALTIEETKTIIDDLVYKIQTVYIDAGSKYNLFDPQDLTDDIYQSMSKDLQPYATEQLIKTGLFDIAKSFCYGGCDAGYFPNSTKYSLRFKMLDSTHEKVTIEYIFPENEVTGHSTEQVIIKKADGTWKLDDFTASNVPLNLTKEEAIEVMAIKDLSGYQFVKEAQLEDPEKGLRKIYLFQANGNVNEQVAIFADTGYNYMLPENTPLLSSTDGQEAVPSSQRDEYLQMLNSLESELAYIDDLYDEKSVAEMVDLEEQRYQRWDAALNDVYGVLEEQLPSNEMEALRQKQREWIVYRDTTAKNGTEQLGGGWPSLQYNINRIDITKDRCYELVNLYMK
ncbi:lysozyme inhibitor LprI family protein [Niallia endozanthoxylica]|uniref:DUF1311 domain-containing protein n=1 Tax=Niallia endozanthoxylica TaxID=2036016 RepID=A0A5J5HMG5_9BACI|nr:lysozyme inhibitor LprI family protein [Niallia endozanthoxylica]KAA9022276.1 DUF1311 domain-containing protein [Niallia endozanthoxylica]